MNFETIVLQLPYKRGHFTLGGYLQPEEMTLINIIKYDKLKSGATSSMNCIFPGIELIEEGAENPFAFRVFVPWPFGVPYAFNVFLVSLSPYSFF